MDASAALRDVRPRHVARTVRRRTEQTARAVRGRPPKWTRRKLGSSMAVGVVVGFLLAWLFGRRRTHGADET